MLQLLGQISACAAIFDKAALIEAKFDYVISSFRL